MKCSLLHSDVWLSKIDWFIILRGVYMEEYSWKLMLFLLHNMLQYTSIILSCILKESFQTPTCWIFCFFSYFCQSGLIQIGLN